MFVAFIICGDEKSKNFPIKYDHLWNKDEKEHHKLSQIYFMDSFRVWRGLVVCFKVITWWWCYNLSVAWSERFVIFQLQMLVLSFMKLNDPLETQCSVVRPFFESHNCTQQHVDFKCHPTQILRLYIRTTGHPIADSP